MLESWRKSTGLLVHGNGAVIVARVGVKEPNLPKEALNQPLANKLPLHALRASLNKL